MMYDLTTFLFWILLALVIGGVVGWSTWSNAKRPDWLRSWLLPATLAFAIGALMAMLSVLPGRAGLWLEVALLMVGAYVLGCLAGGQLKEYAGLGDTSAMSPGGPGNSVAFAGATAAARPWADSPSPAAQVAASIEADRLAAEAAAKAEADRLAAEAAAKAEADRLAAEAAAKAEADRLAAEAAAKAEADRLAAEAAAKAEADRLAAEAAATAEADRLAAEAAAKAEADRLAAEAAAKAEAERLAAETVATAEAEAARLAAEATAKAEAERLAAEAAANAEADRLAAEVATVVAEPAESAAAEDGRPPALPAPDGAADDLKLIKGIGPKNEAILNDIGVHHFSQIADWSPAHAGWVGHHMAFPGRIEREHWIAQAKLLAAGVDTVHSTAVKSGALTIDERADAPLTEHEANDLMAQLPTLMPSVENEEAHAGSRPLGLASPRGGQADDLKLIKGIGKQNEARLHGLGIWHFAQIAAWSADHAKWVGSYLAFAGRIEREQWVSQAKELASGGSTEFARRVEAGLVKSSLDDGSHGQDNVEVVQPRD